MSNGGDVVEFLTPADRDQRVMQLRLAGVSIRAIGKEFKLTDRAVISALDRALPVVTAVTRARYLRETLATYDYLQTCWYLQAKSSTSAAALVMEISKRRAQLLGLDAPQHVRLDPVQLVAGGKPDENSTEALLRELNRIAGERDEPSCSAQ